MSKLDDQFREKRQNINEMNAPADFDAVIKQTVKSEVSRGEKMSGGYKAVLNYAIAGVICVAFAAFMFIGLPGFKANVNATPEPTANQVVFTEQASTSPESGPSQTQAQAQAGEIILAGLKLGDPSAKFFALYGSENLGHSMTPQGFMCYYIDTPNGHKLEVFIDEAADEIKMIAIMSEEYNDSTDFIVKVGDNAKASFEKCRVLYQQATYKGQDWTGMYNSDKAGISLYWFDAINRIPGDDVVNDDSKITTIMIFIDMNPF